MVIHHMLAMGAGFLLSSANLQTANPPALTGIWENERCVIQERAGTRTSSRSTFVFLDDEWALELIQYSDAACTTPSLRAFFQGRYRIIRPSTVVQGAYDADFGFTRKRLTLCADALLAEANRGACGERTNVGTLLDALDVRGPASWSPDGKWVAVAANRGEGTRLFKIPTDGGQPVRLLDTLADQPVWSPDGRFILYSELLAAGRDEIEAITQDGVPVPIPRIRIGAGVATSYRFLPDSTG